MTLVFRLDDFAASPVVPVSVDRAVIEAFSSRKLPLVVAVTPFMVADVHKIGPQPFFPIANDQGRLALLNREALRGSQIALHGHNHARSLQQDSTEFGGEPKWIQVEKIKEGRTALAQCLRNIPVEVFVPPWNAHDTNTVISLRDCGFKVLCGGPEPACSNYDPLQFVPSLFETRQFVDYLCYFSIKSLMRLVGDAALVITLHGYDFFDRARPGYCALSKLERCLDDVVRCGVGVSTLPIGSELRKPNRLRTLHLRSHALLLNPKQTPLQRFVLRLRELKTAGEGAGRGGTLVDAMVVCLYTCECIRQKLRNSATARALWSLLRSKRI